MPAPFSTTNPGEITRLEGVYNFEKDPPGFIRGVFLGTIAVCGETLRGPVDVPVEITSEARFIEVFGQRARFGSATTVNEVRTFLMNKPIGRVIVVRAAAAAAAVGEADFNDTDSCDIATTADLAATFSAVGGAAGKGQFTGAPVSVDGETPIAGDRILVKDQTLPAENGIYVVTAVVTVWDRATDFDDDSEVVSNYVVDILTGTLATNRYRLTTADPIVVNTTAQTWTIEGVGGASVPIVNIAATSPGAWSLDLSVNIEAASDADITHWDLVVNYRGQTTRYKNLNTTASNDNLVAVLGTDLANLVVVTKLADGTPNKDQLAALGDTVASDGSIADTDYTATDRAIEQIANYKGAAIVAVAERANATINAKMLVEAVASSDRMFLIWNGSHTAASAAVIADAALYRSDRIVYCYNSPQTFDFEVGGLLTVPPHSWLASVMSQNDIDIHPGAPESKAQTAGIAQLSFENISREGYISLKEAGVSAWERDIDGGFLLVSGVTTSLVTNLTQITRRRMADFLQISAAQRLQFFVKKKNTLTNRAQMLAEVDAFSSSLQNQERVIEEFEPAQSITTDAERAQGIENILWRVRILSHMLHIVLTNEIGTTVTFREV